MELPKDLDDLYIAPVAIALDQELERFTSLDQDEILLRIALETNTDPRGTDERRAAVLEALTRDVDLHGSELSWDARGLRLSNDGRALVLGLPRSLQEFLGA